MLRAILTLFLLFVGGGAPGRQPPILPVRTPAAGPEPLPAADATAGRDSSRAPVEDPVAEEAAVTPAILPHRDRGPSLLPARGEGFLLRRTLATGLRARRGSERIDLLPLGFSTPAVEGVRGFVELHFADDPGVSIGLSVEF